MGEKDTEIIVTRGLTKRYGNLVAVDHLDLTIRRGEIFGLLGPNGAGKTTTILMLLGLTEPAEGTAQVAGHDPTREPLAVKRQVGYLPENVGFYEDLTARENLAYTARLNGIGEAEARKRLEELLERVGLAAAADRRVREFSRGMRQRLGIADALVKNPRLLILDEPTLGIDPEGVREVLALITGLANEEGLTVLISSHLLYQIQEICHRVGIFVGGRLIAAGPITELGRQILANEPLTLELQAEPGGEPLWNLLRETEGVEKVIPSGELTLIRCLPGHDPRPQLAGKLITRGMSLLHLRARGLSLDDIYRRYFQGGDGR